MWSKSLRIPLALSLLLVGVSILSGCGSNSGTTGPQNCIADATASTPVPLLFTSDAPLGNLTALNLGIDSITLTDACGKSTTVYTGPPENTVFGVAGVEFVHVNGVSEPLAVATVAEAAYTSASVTYSTADLDFIYPDNVHFDSSAYAMNPTSAKVEMAKSISVGPGTTIVFDLLSAQPIDITTIGSLGAYDPNVTPVFEVSSFSAVASPTNDRNGLAYVRGLTASASSSGFTIANSVGIPITIKASSSTSLQGFGNMAAMPLNVTTAVDLAIQTDGSLVATRIQVEDAASKGAWIGPLVLTYPTGAYQEIMPQLWQQASDPTHTSNDFLFQFQFTGNTLFQRSGASYDLTDLPFTPSFASFADVALGQGLSISWMQQQQLASQPQTAADTATLVPRTFSGTITQVNAGSNYVQYILQLGTQDTMLRLSNTSSIAAYTNAGTRMEDGPLSVGMAVNMHGLLYSDRGTLRLVCDQTRIQQQP